MKKFLTVLFSIAIIIACNSNDTSTGSQAAEKPKDPEVQKGFDLVAKDDCFTCHKVSEQYQGPAYEAIAERYKGNAAAIDTLAQNIMKGSEGRWGSIPMISHPSLSEENARLMVKYVLSLKKS